MIRLNSFQVWCRGKELTPQLITARSFGEWCKKVFSEQVCRKYLYVASKKKGSEYHPGTKIGNYFDNNKFKDSVYNSWYVPKESEAFQYLIKNRLAEYRDICRFRKEEKFKHCLRCFTVPQIRLFVQEMVKDFGLDSDNLIDVKVKTFTLNTTYNDSLSYVVKFNPRTPLFGNCERTLPIPMTLSEVEDMVGHKIILVSEKEK